MIRIVKYSVIAALCLYPVVSLAGSTGSSVRSGGFSSSSSFKSSTPSYSAPKVSSPPAVAPRVSAPPVPPAAATTKPQISLPTTSGGFSGAPAPKPPPIASGGFSSTPAKSTSVPQVNNVAPKPTAFDKAINRKMSSDVYKAKESEIKSSRETPIFKSAVGNKTYSPVDIQTRRDTYYEQRRREPNYYEAPLVRDSYGSFSGPFLGSLLGSSISNAIFAYNHRDSNEYKQWRQDMEEKAKNDEKLRARLNELDAKVKELEEKKTPVDKSFLPAEVPPEVAFNKEVLTGKVDGEKESSHYFLWFMIFTILGIVAFGTYKYLNRRRPGYGYLA